MVTINREKYRGKFYSVVRDKNKKVIERQRWSPKVKLSTLRSRFKKNRSIKTGFKRVRLKNVVEVSDFSDMPSKPRKMNYQVVVTGKLADGRTITARSRQHEPGYSIREARKEAEESFYERISQASGGKYDEDEGRDFAESRLKSMKEGVVFYRAIA